MNRNGIVFGIFIVTENLAVKSEHHTFIIPIVRIHMEIARHILAVFFIIVGKFLAVATVCAIKSITVHRVMGRTCGSAFSVGHAPPTVHVSGKGIILREVLENINLGHTSAVLIAETVTEISTGISCRSAVHPVRAVCRIGSNLSINIYYTVLIGHGMIGGKRRINEINVGYALSCKNCASVCLIDKVFGCSLKLSFTKNVIAVGFSAESRSTGSIAVCLITIVAPFIKVKFGAFKLIVPVKSIGAFLFRIVFAVNGIAVAPFEAFSCLGAFFDLFQETLCAAPGGKMVTTLNNDFFAHNLYYVVIAFNLYGFTCLAGCIAEKNLVFLFVLCIKIVTLGYVVTERGIVFNKFICAHTDK